MAGRSLPTPGLDVKAVIASTMVNHGDLAFAEFAAILLSANGFLDLQSCYFSKKPKVKNKLYIS